VRTTFEPLDFFAGIYQHSDYLFQLSEDSFEVEQNFVCYSFQSFEYQYNLSKRNVFCLVNKSIDEKQYLVGKSKNSCYILPQKWDKNQFTFPFENEEEKIKKNREEAEWELFKSNMKNTSVDLMGKIDYLFLVDIQTYEILKPLFLKFSDIHFLNHQFIDAKQVNEIDSFLSIFYAHSE
jgi:hypothetical protein